MKTIWKAPIRPDAEHGTTWKLKIPARRGAKALSVGLQKVKGVDTVMVWFEVDPDELGETMILYSVGTGCGEIPKDCRFIGTVIEGEYVWHIYAEK